jgi:hypothetical protein
MIVILLAVIASIILYAFYSYFYGSESQIAEVNADRVSAATQKADTEDTLGGSETTPQMEKDLARKDREEAKEAVRQNRTNIPVIVSSKPEKKKPTPKDPVAKKVSTSFQQHNPKEVAQTYEKDTSSRRKSRPTKDDRIARQNMIDAIRDIREGMTVRAPSYVKVETQAYEANNPSQVSSQPVEDGHSPEEIQHPSDLDFLQTGKTFYCVNEYTINSDSPKKNIVLRVLAPQEAYNAKFFGQFARYDEMLVLEVNRFVFQGREYPVNGLAIDPEDADVDVATDVDTHPERWVLFAAATFLEGVSDIIQASGTTTSVSDGTVTQSKENSSTTDVILGGAGKVGQKASGALTEDFNRPPTVKMRPGAEVAVILIEGN